MARAIIHNKGPKVERDRAKLLKLYDSFCRAFPWYVPVPLDALNNFQINALCKEVWEAQSQADQSAYMALLKTSPKDVVEAPKPLRFRNLIVPAEFLEAPNV